MLVFLHLVAAAFWLGGLMLLPIIVFAGLRTLDRESFRRLLRTSGRAFAVGSGVAWLVLGATGFLMARQRLGSLADLNRTTFGQRLSLKIALAGVALLAAVAHTITGRSKSGPVLMVSRSLAGVAFLATVGVFYQATRLGV